VNDETNSLRPIRLGVLVSGRGSNLQAIIHAIENGELSAEIALVVCNHSGAKAIQRAVEASIPVEVYELRGFTSRIAKQRVIAGRFRQQGVDLVVCAGWDRVLNPEFVDQFAGRIINVHPSLLPAFAGGLHAIDQALQMGVKITGCTVHFVTREVDSGPIISQAPVQVFPDDTAETLGERIHVTEHRLLVEAIRLFSEGRLLIKDKHVEITPAA